MEPKIRSALKHSCIVMRELSSVVVAFFSFHAIRLWRSRNGTNNQNIQEIKYTIKFFWYCVFVRCAVDPENKSHTRNLYIHKSNERKFEKKNFNQDTAIRHELVNARTRLRARDYKTGRQLHRKKYICNNEHCAAQQ